MNKDLKNENITESESSKKITEPELSKKRDRKNESITKPGSSKKGVASCGEEDSCPAVSPGGISTFRDANEVVRFKLNSLQRTAVTFGRECFYGPENEKRTLVWPGGELSLTNKTSGISWVGVNGAGPTWVAAVGGVEHRSKSRKQLRTHTLLTVSLADMTGEAVFRSLMPLTSQAGPFAVVSVAPYESSEVTSEQCKLASLAIKFLKEKLGGCSKDIPSEEVRQIAVSALELLMGQEYMSNAVEVAGFGFGRCNWGAFNGKMSDFEPIYFD